MLTTRERKERRLQRRKEWAESRRRKAEAARKAADAAIEGIPLGQPILVGHHSEKRHRRAIEKHDRNFYKVGEHLNMAERHESKAFGIQDQLDRSIYSDDEDAPERLQERIDELDARRQRMKTINQWLRKHAGIPRSIPYNADPETIERAAQALRECKEALHITEEEGRELLRALEFSQSLGFPPYALSNLSANIRRNRQRLEALQRDGGHA